MLKMIMKPLKPIMKMLMAPLKMLDDSTVSTVVKMFLILYASMIAPKLPETMLMTMKNPVIKMAILFLMVYTTSKDPTMSLLIAVGFTLTMHALRQLETTKTVAQMLNVALDVPQKLLNDIIDGTQDIVGKGGKKVGGPVELVLDTVNDVVDLTQGVVNSTIDGIQKVVLKQE